MDSRVYSTAVFALYQVTLLVGICLLPVAIAVRKVGVSLPLHRAILRLARTYERATGE